MIRTTLRLTLPLLALAGLAACATDGARAPLEIPPLATEQYPLEAREHPEEILLAAHPDGLSPAQAEALAVLARRWMETGGGDVVIRTPSAGADPRAAHETSLAARERLLSLGVPALRIQRVGYTPQAGGPAAVVVGFAAFEAVIPACGRAWENLASTGGNKPMRNFGCSVTANMAAQIANPGDIVQPPEMGPVDAQRRAAVLDKYRRGETTSTARDTQAVGTMATVAGSN